MAVKKENIENSLSTGRKLAADAHPEFHRIFSTIFLPLYCARRLQAFATPLSLELSRNDQALLFYPRSSVYLHASAETLETCFQVEATNHFVIDWKINLYE